MRQLSLHRVRGILQSGNASLSDPVSLPGELTVVPVTTQPGEPFRIVLRLIWYRADASIEGTRMVLVDHHRARDGGCLLYTSPSPRDS